MKKVHEIHAFMDEIDNSLTYRHSRHKKGECPWCDFIRVGEVSREFLWRLDHVYGTDVPHLNMWSLGTSLKDTKSNRKLLQRWWHLLQARKLDKKGWNPVFRVVEAGRRGYLHLHVIVPTYVRHEVILYAWRSITGEGSNVHVSGQKGRQDPHRLANYLLKYLTKESSSYWWCGCFMGLGRKRRCSLRGDGQRRQVRYMGVTCYTYETEAYPEKKKEKLF